MKLDIKKTKEYLETEYGIRNVEELEEAAERLSDIDIGLFITPFILIDRRRQEVQNEKVSAVY